MNNIRVLCTITCGEPGCTETITAPAVLIANIENGGSVEIAVKPDENAMESAGFVWRAYYNWCCKEHKGRR